MVSPPAVMYVSPPTLKACLQVDRFPAVPDGLAPITCCRIDAVKNEHLKVRWDTSLEYEIRG